MKKLTSVLILSLIVSVGMAGCKNITNKQSEVSQHYFHLYILSNSEFLNAIHTHQSPDSLDKLIFKSDLYYEVYQKTRP